MLVWRQQRLTGDKMGQYIRRGTARREFVLRQEIEGTEPIGVIAVLAVTWGRSAITSGPPERCRESEGTDWDLVRVVDHDGNDLEPFLTSGDYDDLHRQIDYAIEAGEI